MCRDWVRLAPANWYVFRDLKFFRSAEIIAGLCMSCRVGWGGGGDCSPMGNGRRPGKTVLTEKLACQRTRQLERIPLASGDHQLLGGDSGFASHPVDDVHQAQIT